MGWETNSAENRVLKIVSDGVQKASEETVKKYGEDLLKTVLPALLSAVIAGPLAAGAAAAVAATVESIFKQTSATERKLDRLLNGPFKTAVTTVREVLSEQVRTKAEEDRANRRLEFSVEELQRAYAYAESKSPERLLLIKLYQAFVAALIEGGGASMRRQLADLRRLAGLAENQANHFDTERAKVRSHDPEYVEKVRHEIKVQAEYSPSDWSIDLRLEIMAKNFQTWAESSRSRANAVRTVVALLEAANTNRREILRANKDYPSNPTT